LASAQQAMQRKDYAEAHRMAERVLVNARLAETIGEAALTPGAMHRLQTLVTVLKAHPERQVTIDGYTDSVGSESYNLELSQRRAEAVRDFLVQNGVDAARITARGYGAAAPIAPNTTEAGRQQNRRVEVIIGRS
jgi:outer membrane protein OmpA-like peptidoglycan-associated protein